MELNELKASRQHLLDSLGFDIYSSPKFVEHLVCRLCNLEQTAKQSSYDGLHSAGFKVEVKHSVICQYTPPTKLKNGKVVVTKTHSFFVFTALQGTHRKGKEADVYVLVGSMHDCLRFFVLASDDLRNRDNIGHRDRVSIFINKKLYQNTGKWLKYEVSIEELQHAVIQAGISQMRKRLSS